MKIRNQSWIESEKFIAITLLEPYWSAWQKYGWDRGVEGFGIAKEAIDYVIKNEKHLRVHVKNYGTYDINPKKLEKELFSNRVFIPRDRKSIYVLPRYAFDKVQTFDKKAYDKKEHKRAVRIAEAEQTSLI